MTFHMNSPSGGATTFGTGSVAGVRGESGLGFYRLTFNLDFMIEPVLRTEDQADLPEITELMAEARLGGRSIGCFTCMPGYLPVRSYAQRSNRVSVPLSCDLDRARAEAIEKVRAGGSVPLDISINVRFGDGQAMSFSEPYVINQGTWLETLAGMGYQRTLLIEVTVPDPDVQPELASAVGLLAQAQKHALQGHDRDAVGTLRDVLEEIMLAFGDDDKIDAGLHRALFTNSRSMSKGERLRVLRRALMLVTHPARHRDQVSVGIDWGRIDSTQMITMVAAFVNEMAAPDARPPGPMPAPAEHRVQAEQPAARSGQSDDEPTARQRK